MQNSLNNLQVVYDGPTEWNPVWTLPSSPEWFAYQTLSQGLEIQTTSKHKPHYQVLCPNAKHVQTKRKKDPFSYQELFMIIYIYMKGYVYICM